MYNKLYLFSSGKKSAFILLIILQNIMSKFGLAGTMCVADLWKHKQKTK